MKKTWPLENGSAVSGDSGSKQRGEYTMAKDVIGSVLVVGGGIAGMQSALDLANSGYYVYLLEKSPAIGGVMSQLDKTFPTNDCAM
jgi:heterodisulfide reductase subunit A-like polyferredoxin